MRMLAHAIRALLLLTLLAAPLPARADPYTDNAALDALFAQLRHAGSEAQADEITRQIWSLWFTPSEPELARRMQYVSLSVATGELQVALLELDIIVEKYPDYAEGWNQRATVLFMLARQADSLADIELVLAIEPRHFGALAGRVLILLQQGQHDAALRAMLAALAIHPYLNERRYFPELSDTTQV